MNEKYYYVRYRYGNLIFGIFIIFVTIAEFGSFSNAAKIIMPLMSLLIAAYVILIFSYKVRISGMQTIDEILFGTIRRTIRIQDISAVTLVHRGIGGHFRYNYSLIGNNLDSNKMYPYFEVNGNFPKDLKEIKPSILLDSYFEHPYKIRYKI
jgi:hypothetical protein